MRQESLYLLVLPLLGLASLATPPAQAQERQPEAPTGSVSSTLHQFTGVGAGPIPDGLGATPPQFGAPLVISFPVNSLTGSVLNIAVGMTLSHTWVGDLDVVLAAPGGAPALTIFSRIGATTASGFGDTSNFGGVNYFFVDDSSTNIWTVAATGCDTTCSLPSGGYATTAPGGAGQTNPAPLTSLMAVFGGLTPAQVNGTWTLSIRDAASTELGSVSSAYLSFITPSGKGDFNGDGKSDIIYRSVLSPAQNKVWMMNGTTRLSEAPVTPDAPSSDWLIRGADDFGNAAAPGFGRDLKTDLVFWNQANGAVEFWLMNGTSRVGPAVPLTGAGPLTTNWDLSATADFNWDGKPDIVWRDFTSQNIVIWIMNGTNVTSAVVPTPAQAVNANWVVVAAADYNNDAFTDFLWYNYTSGKIVTWYRDASFVRITGQFTAPDAAGNNNWKVVASADYSLRTAPATPPLGSPDIIWRNLTSGNQVIWHMDFASTRTTGGFTTPTANTPALDWVIAGPR